MPVKGKPFQAKSEWVHRKILQSGRDSAVTEIGALYRDQEGRERIETHAHGEHGELVKITADIYDPVANSVCFLDVAAKVILFKDKLSISHFWTLTINIDGRWATALPRGEASGDDERVGSRQVEGLFCDGYRRTESERYAMEYWVSQELKETLLVKLVTETQESTYQLYDVVRGVPDKRLFIVPTDFKEAVTMR